MNLETIKAEITSPALKEIAASIIETVNGHNSKKIKLEDARLKISGCKHLLQIMAIEAMKEAAVAGNGLYIPYRHIKNNSR